jgi:putative membrane-bound dehydrogenase-like protein
VFQVRPLRCTAPFSLVALAGFGLFAFAGAGRPLVAQAAPPKPVVSSPLITASTPGHALPLTADIRGAKDLYLVVTDGGDGFGCDWADWAEPRLTGPAGTLKLTDLKWKTAQSEWGRPGNGVNVEGGALRIQGKSVEFGIGTHANSTIHFSIPEGYEKFTARVGLDNGGTDQGGGGSVQFHVFTQAPGPLATAAPGVDRTPESAVSGLDVGEGLEVRLFAAEPRLLSPSNIDVDHLGRIWVCEVVNYRRFANGGNPDRPAGDRILVLEDSDGDGLADRETVFYQGREIDSAHGVCVLGSRVIVSAGDSVFSFHDDNGDLKADRKEVLFTGIKGTQHDHGIHSFTFGPDGRLYFNFGNSGEELHTPDGKIVVDLAGNEIRASRKPYQEGMAFRCELDGSRVETLGWNFRNNWELCVDSFGTIWQSDNDDDGNRGVRINYVMEFGNYGYKDELTGAGWQQPRTNLETEIPLRHWHLNDPGVVPNLLQTGAGSPTGILVYEGDALPDRFRNQLIHCDAGPNIVRSYATTVQGAGYSADVHPVLTGSRDQWFRPSDVCVAPDGSLIVADWYDPGVGGHRQGDVDRGRLFRVSLPGRSYSVPKPDFSTPAGAAAALKSPNVATRYLAWTALQKAGAAAVPVLESMYASDPNPRFRARSLWLLGQMDGKGSEMVQRAVQDRDADIRITGLRLARRLGLELPPIVLALVNDVSPAVRRECAIALRFLPAEEKTKLLAALAAHLDPTDRWAVEALGIGAGSEWDAVLTSLAAERSSRDAVSQAAVDALIWRSRGPSAAAAKVLRLRTLLQAARDAASADQPALQAEAARWFRSLDFDERSVVSRECTELLGGDLLQGLSGELAVFVTVEALSRTAGDASSPAAAAALARVLEKARGSSQFVALVKRFQRTEHYADLLSLAQNKPSEQLGVEAMSALLDLKQLDLISKSLRGTDPAVAAATAEVLGNTANGSIVAPLLDVIQSNELRADVRRSAVKAVSRVNNGAMELVKLVDSKALDAELEQSVAAALHSAPSRQAREQAQRLFPLPASKDNSPTPPISELTKLKGDPANGRMVFFSTGTCHKCHVVDGMGREIGPNLSEIGSKLSREAMFESVLYPSAGISHNYEAWTVVLSSGTTVNGLLVSNTDAELQIRGDDAIVRTFRKGDVEELVKQKISLMPADLQKTMTSQELADVVEYMQGLKKKQ